MNSVNTKKGWHMIIKYVMNGNAWMWLYQSFRKLLICVCIDVGETTLINLIKFDACLKLDMAQDPPRSSIDKTVTDYYYDVFFFTL